MADNPPIKKPSAEDKRKKDARNKIDNELQKIEAVVRKGTAFGDVTTEAEFEKLATAMLKAYGYEPKKSMFKTVKKVDSGTNTKPK